MPRRVALRRVCLVIGSQILTAGTDLAAPISAAKPVPLTEHLATEMLSAQLHYEVLTVTIAQVRKVSNCSRAAIISSRGSPDTASGG